METGTRARCAILALVAAFGGCPPAAAQTPAADGDWIATFPDEQGHDRKATLRIEGNSGSWRLFPLEDTLEASTSDPCLLRDFPVTVRPGGPDAMTLDVDGAQVLAGCSVFTVTLRRAAGGTFDGAFADKRKVHIARE